MNLKESLSNSILSRAKDGGFSGHTVKGAIRFLKNAPKRSRARFDSRVAMEYHLAAEKARVANPEAKRALSDKTFRADWMKKQKAALSKLTNPPQNSVDQIVSAVKGRAARLAAVNSIIASFKIAKVKIAPPEMKKAKGVLIIFSEPFAKKKVEGVLMRGVNATLGSTRHETNFHHEAGETTWKNGKPVSYTRASYENKIQSFGLIKKNTLYFIFNGNKGQMAAPVGCKWEVDDNGIKLVRGRDDFHPMADDLLSKKPIELILRKIAENAEKRKMWEAKTLVDKAEMEGIFVCAADSLRAGNCQSGTINFIERYGLTPSKHYSASEIFSRAKDSSDAGRLKIAIAAAIYRTKKENERGFAELQEHKI